MAPPQTKPKSRPKSPAKALSKAKRSNSAMKENLSANKSKDSSFTVKAEKSSEKVVHNDPSPDNRDAYIDYALDLVVESLVNNGSFSNSWHICICFKV